MATRSFNPASLLIAILSLFLILHGTLDANSQESAQLNESQARAILSALDIPYSEEAFFKAIEEDDVRVVRLFHQGGVDLNTNDLGQSPPIYVATDFGSYKVFRYLLASNVDVNIRNQWNGWTALVRAISHKQQEMVWALLNAGAVALFDPTISGAALAGSALDYAIISEDPVLVKELLKPTRFGSVKERSIHAQTPLMDAVARSSVQVVKLLLEAGASVTDVDKSGKTALSHALNVENPQFAIVHNLIDAGSDVNHRGKYGVFPLMMASFHGDQYVLRLLLESGANPDVVFQEKEKQSIPFSFLELQNKDFIDAISGGVTSLMVASVLGHEKIAKTLLEFGADPKITAIGQEQSHTAESLAVSAGHMEIAKKIEFYADSDCMR